jgi:hypothetical protein
VLPTFPDFVTSLGQEKVDGVANLSGFCYLLEIRKGRQQGQLLNTNLNSKIENTLFIWHVTNILLIKKTKKKVCPYSNFFKQMLATLDQSEQQWEQIYPKKLISWYMLSEKPQKLCDKIIKKPQNLMRLSF